MSTTFLALDIKNTLKSKAYNNIVNLTKSVKYAIFYMSWCIILVVQS